MIIQSFYLQWQLKAKRCFSLMTIHRIDCKTKTKQSFCMLSINPARKDRNQGIKSKEESLHSPSILNLPLSMCFRGWMPREGILPPSCPCLSPSLITLPPFYGWTGMNWHRILGSHYQLIWAIYYLKTNCHAHSIQKLSRKRLKVIQFQVCLDL